MKILEACNGKELPKVETERLILRQRTVADAEDIFDYASRPEVSYPAGFPPVKTLEDETISQLATELLSKGRKESLVLLTLIIGMKMMYWRLAMSYTQIIGDEAMFRKLLVPWLRLLLPF